MALTHRLPRPSFISSRPAHVLCIIQPSSHRIITNHRKRIARRYIVWHPAVFSAAICGRIARSHSLTLSPRSPLSLFSTTPPSTTSIYVASRLHPPPPSSSSTLLITPCTAYLQRPTWPTRAPPARPAPPTCRAARAARSSAAPSAPGTCGSYPAGRTSCPT